MFDEHKRVVHQKTKVGSIENDIFYRDLIGSLSRRQTDVLYLMLSGFSVKMIACQLDIGVETVKSHIQNIKLKFDCACTPELIKACFEKKVQTYLSQVYTQFDYEDPIF